MNWLKEWINKNTSDGKKSLFFITAMLTLIYFTLMGLRAFWNAEIAVIPPAGIVVYLTLLSAYVGIKGVNMIKNNGGTASMEKRKGELFFVAWMVLAGVLWVMGGLQKGNAALVLQENLSTFLTVMGLYMGSESSKVVVDILNARKKKNGEEK